VVPKAQTFASDDEEKTTIESGWEDEASTTIEQGELAEKLRAFGTEPVRRNTNITSTNGGALDEPTVDDRHANIAVVVPTAATARLVITQGNDTGQALEVQPGKTYTIGRAIDNDFVLTDIAVSRKHFDLRHEAGSWVIVDRGSGNGTVVNGNVEDQPFMLASGDTIEIGNTTFRFDQPDGAARSSAFTVDLDEDEASTVAGKPLREDLEPPAQLAPPLPRRPRTVPPPAPLPRQRPPSVGPPPSYGQGSMPAPAMTLPMPQQLAQSRPVPALGAQAPTMLGGDPMMRPQLLANAARPAHEGMPPMHGMLPTTIPGQGPPIAPSQPQGRAMPYAYPNLADMPPQHAQLHANGAMPRDPTSTALVQPAPYGTIAPPSLGGYAPPTATIVPQLSKRMKMMLGLAALTVCATIATVAILKSSSKGTAKTPTPSPGKATVESIQEPKAAPKPQVMPITEPAKPTKAETAKAEAAKAEVAKAEAAKAEAAKAEAAKAEAAKAEAAKAEAAKTAKAETEAARAARARTEAARSDAARAEAAKRDAAKREAAARAEAARREAAEAAKRERAKRQAERPTERPTKRTATADTSGAKNTADNLYRSKKFNDAAATLRKAASSVGGSDASDLKSIAAVYEQVGRNYNLGMGPATKPTDAFDALTRAQNLDRGAGGAFVDEIRAKLSQVAPRAAISFMAAKQYENAARAVRTAESLGAANSSTKAVRDGLESQAGALYASAMKELGSNPDAAKAKLRQVKAMVDAKSPWAAKAQKALNGGG